LLCRFVGGIQKFIDLNPDANSITIPGVEKWMCELLDIFLQEQTAEGAPQMVFERPAEDWNKHPGVIHYENAAKRIPTGYEGCNTPFWNWVCVQAQGKELYRTVEKDPSECTPWFPRTHAYISNEVPLWREAKNDKQALMIRYNSALEAADLIGSNTFFGFVHVLFVTHLLFMRDKEYKEVYFEGVSTPGELNPVGNALFITGYRGGGAIVTEHTKPVQS